MDIELELIKEEFADLTESIVNIKSESEYVPMDFKTKRDMYIENQIGTSMKQELDDDMWNINDKKDVPEVKEELSSNDDVEEKLPQIKTEELILKSECEDDDNEKKTHWKNRMKDHLMTKHDGSLMKESSIEMYACDVCDYKTDQKGDLNSHIIAEHVKNISSKYSCYSCDYKTQKICLLENHIFAMHSKNAIKKYSCTYCRYKSFYESNLKNHVVTKHNNNSIRNGHIIADHVKNISRKYSCYSCDYKTRKINLLENHIFAMHSKNAIKKYSCTYCRYKSFYESNLENHVVTKHNNYSIKQYSCRLCEYSTPFHNALISHVMQVHRTIKQYGGARLKCISNYKSIPNDQVVTKHNNDSVNGTAAILASTVPNCSTRVTI